MISKSCWSLGPTAYTKFIRVIFPILLLERKEIWKTCMHFWNIQIFMCFFENEQKILWFFENLHFFKYTSKAILNGNMVETKYTFILEYNSSSIGPRCQYIYCECNCHGFGSRQNKQGPCSSSNKCMDSYSNLNFYWVQK